MYILLHKKIKGKTYSIRHYIGFPNLSLENQALMGFHEATTGSRVRKLGQQAASMAKLQHFAFTWVLPGHGQRIHLPREHMSQELRTLVRRMH